MGGVFFRRPVPGAAGGDPAAQGEEPRVEYADGRSRGGPREAGGPLGHGGEGDFVVLFIKNLNITSKLPAICLCTSNL